MGLDQALISIKTFGLWQITVYLLVGLSYGPAAIWQMFAIVFIGFINPHICKPDANYTYDEWSPIEIDSYGYEVYSSCRRYKYPKTNDTSVVNCNSWCYHPFVFSPDKGTISMAWDLVCDKDTFVETSQTIFNVGVVVGFLVFTPMQDLFGRKRMMYYCCLVMNFFGLAMSFAPNYYVFCTMQFLTGAFAAGLYMSGLVITTELFPSKWRDIMAPASYLFFSIGVNFLSLWAYLIRNWRELQFGISIAGFLSLLTYPLCPESMRWLLVNGRIEEVKESLHKGARWNNTKFDESLLYDEINQEATDEAKNASMKDMFRHSNSRRYILVMIYLVFSNNLAYYGLSLMTTSLSGDIYVNFFIVSILEIPGTLAAVAAMSLIGRRYPLVFFRLFGAVFLIISSVFTTVKVNGQYNDTLVTAMALIAKFGIQGGFIIELIYSLEIYPTNLRGTGMGLTTGFGFVGSILSPYTVYLYRKEPIAPGLIFAGLNLIGAGLALLQPETLGRPLPTTVKEINDWSLTHTEEEKENARQLRKRAKETVLKFFRCSKSSQSSKQTSVVGTPKNDTKVSKNGIENPVYNDMDSDKNEMVESETIHIDNTKF